ncbi:MAG: hypothetical protein HKN11_09650 [Rhizobiales bacterium]|nr:hypothetical protein [Hyphomicrobiales bacterium]
MMKYFAVGVFAVSMTGIAVAGETKGPVMMDDTQLDQVVGAGVRDVSNRADVLHPNIHQNVTGGNNANPNGVSPAGGANLHGIGNNPGQGGTNPNDDGVAGFANELETVHGGIGAVNQNAD